MGAEGLLPPSGAAATSVLLIDMELLVDALHGDLAAVGDDTHETGADVADVVVPAQEFDMVADGLMGIRVPGTY